MTIFHRSGWRALGLALGLLWAASGHAGVEANQAPAADLVAIKGIGPGTSQNILQARQQRPFQDWNDFIQRVRGVGPATAAKMSANGLTVNGLRFEAQAAGPPEVWKPFIPRPLEPVR
jgi:competence protein ComEA